jgi:hypothetical protein
MENIRHFINTFRARNIIRNRHKEELRDLNEDYKSLEKKVIQFLLEKKETALQVENTIILLKERKKPLSKSEQIKKITEILNDSNRTNLTSQEFALTLVNTTKLKCDDVSSYTLQVFDIDTSKQQQETK